jgi:3',5'-cyclic AMP phosphodiesterase CpdA
VVVTGDIAAIGIKDEYELAEKFFKDLRSALEFPVESMTGIKRVYNLISESLFRAKGSGV